MSVKISKFCFKGKDFCLCFRINENRSYVKVKELEDPDFNTWDQKKQMFVEASQKAIHNNNVLNMMRTKYQSTIDAFPDITTKEQLIEYCNNAEKILASKGTTLGDFLRETINLMKVGDGHNMPSRNFQVYITLLHSLEDYSKWGKSQNKTSTIDKKISDINNRDYEDYGTWINSQTPPDRGNTNNYIGKMKHFHAIMERARKKHLTDKELIYKYSDATPLNELNKNSKRGTLTEEEFNDFIALDMSKIYLGGGNTQYYKELYRDFCILMTVLNVRPVDCIKLHWGDVTYDDELKCYAIRFLPEKKKNVRNKSHHIQPVYIQSELAINIIGKYKGKSKGGYMLPFAMNEHKWNMEDAKEFKRFDNRKGKTLESINLFLKKVQKEMKLGFNLTTYSFRHTGINITINKYGPAHTAMMAGTSIAMLDNTYIHAEIALKNDIISNRIKPVY